MGGFVQLGIAGKAIVRGDELPFAGDFHPDVGQAIAIVVGFSVKHAAFVRVRCPAFRPVQRTPAGQTRGRTKVRIWLAKGRTAWVCDNLMS